MSKPKSVVLFSGGQDSATVLAYAKRQSNPIALSVSYGQRHVKEVEAATRICAKWRVPQRLHKVELLNKDSDLLAGKGGITMTQTHKGEMPTSIVPNRNAVLLTFAHAYAQSVGATTVYGGMCQTDYSGYPDCREVFIAALQGALNLGCTSAPIRIITPLMHKTKAETWSLADELGVVDDVVNLTRTCYYGDDTMQCWGMGCGECPACMLRRKGWNEFVGGRNA